MMTFKNISFLFFNLLLLWFLHANYCAAETTGKIKLCRIIFSGPVTPSMVEFHIISGMTSHMRQKQYLAEREDNIKIDNHGRRILIREGKPLGFLAGVYGDHISSFESIELPDLPKKFWDQRENYKISSENDPSYKKPTPPCEVFRKSVPLDAVATPKGLKSATLHKIFLKLPFKMKKRKSYTFSFNKNSEIKPSTMVYRPEYLRSSAVHVTHAGFRTDDTPKTAFISLWMGTGGPLKLKSGKSFSIINNRTGEKALSGEITLSKPLHSFDDRTGKNYNFTDIWEADFSELKEEGSYRVCIEEIGCSFPFKIAPDVWLPVHTKILRAFYNQRSGISAGPPFTLFKRKAGFRPGKEVKIFSSITPLMATPNGYIEGEDNFKALIYGSTEKEIKGSWGGYFDAGDWDRRIQHLKLSRYLFDLYERYKDFFSRLTLNIPESDNKLPDIIDEALWAIDFFIRLQTPEGGVRGGVESGGHPLLGETSWQESQNVYAYAPGVWSSYLLAATAAKAAITLKKLTPDNAEKYKNSALKAMQWAEKEVLKDGGMMEIEVKDARNLAASELYRLTGKEKYHSIFIETTAFHGKAPLRKYEHHDQAEAALSYTNITDKKTDPVIRKACLNAIIEAADTVISAQKSAGFKWAKRPWLPAFGGVFTSPDIPEVVWAYWLSGEKKYLSCLCQAMQYTLGANPLNMSYITGTGYKSPESVMNFDARVTGQKIFDGITVLGPLDLGILGGSRNIYYRTLGENGYPDPLFWPVMETFWDVFWFPMMCEYSIDKMTNNVLITGTLAARK